MVVGNEERKAQSGTMNIVKVEDYSGATDFAIFEKQKAEFGHLLVPGTAVCVIGSFKQFTNRTTGVRNLRFSLDRILPLDSLRGKLIEEMIIKVNPSQTAQVVELLQDPVNTGDPGEGRPEPVPLSMVVYAADIGRKLTFSTALKVNVTRQFLTTLDDLDIDYQLRHRNIAV